MSRAVGFLLAATSIAAVGTTQDFDRVRPPIAIQGAIVPDPAEAVEDPGRPVQMLESPNVDRFLRAAQDFLARDNFPGAVRILQDVIDGRTLEDPAAHAGSASDGGQDERGGGTGASAPPEVWADLVESSESAVFSSDGRIYHPVRRLCHELLAAMPIEGVTWYRARFEVEAERALAEAELAFDPLRYEAVYERFFLTLAAGRAMRTAGDLLMDAGRLRAAIRAYHLLLDVYPEEARRKIGVDDLWVRFRVATCFGLMGDADRARQEIEAIGRDRPDATLRLQGELVAITDLRNLAMFGKPTTDSRPDAPGVVALRSGDESLVPLFEYRFADDAPYRPAKGSSTNQRVVAAGNGTELTATPRSGDYLPGTSVSFDRGQLTLLDHFRLEVLALPGGHLLAQSEGPAEVPNPQPGLPRVRVPAYDFASLRVTADDERYFVVVGPRPGRLPGMQAVTRNSLEVWTRAGFAPAWSSKNFPVLDDVTFMTAPTVFGSRILVPVASKGTFGVMCFEGATGELVFHVPLHRDGTEMTRPPAVPVAVSAGVAFVATNAGALAAIDAYTGAVRWIRRYERVDPFRPPARSRGRARARPDVFGGGSFFQELPLEGFAPSDLVLIDDLVIHAPCDGRVLICLDGASGEPVWMVERDEMQYVIGHDGEFLYVGGPDSVTCIGLRSGVRKWRDSLPPHPGSSRWRGRGVVADDVLLIPGERAILARRLEPGAIWESKRLPSLQLGREPLLGEFNLFQDGPYVVAAFAGGIEVYSTVEALTALADQSDDPMRRASLEAQAGDLTAAVATLEGIDLDARPDLRPEASRRMLALCSELALALASHGAREEALGMLGRCRGPIDDDRLVQRWHLARIEVFQALGDLDGVAQEQDALYGLMGRRG